MARDFERSYGKPNDDLPLLAQRGDGRGEEFQIRIFDLIATSAASCISRYSAIRPFLRPRALVTCIAWIGLVAILLTTMRTEAQGTPPNAPVARSYVPKPTRLGDEIENFYRLSANIYSGATPENPNAFEALQRLGVKTIVSVDGATPDAATAEKYGIRYVHLPMGYGNISTNETLRLAKAAATLPKPIFVHCHHGQHRGPTAAGLMCMTTDNWSPRHAVQWMHHVGTSTNYPNLYEIAQQFERPDAKALEAIPAEFPAKAPVAKIVDLMVAIDQRFEHLKSAKASGFQVSPDHPDVDPKHEALQLYELFHEYVRSDQAKERGESFSRKLEEAEQFTKEFHLLLSDTTIDVTHATGAYDRVAASCASCHKEFRN